MKKAIEKYKAKLNDGKHNAYKNNKYLRFILKRVGHKPYLWEFNRREVVMATWIGVFWAMVPMPFQMIPAVIMSVVFRANILVAIAWVWLSNPFTMLPIFYFEYIFKE